MTGMGTRRRLWIRIDQDHHTFGERLPQFLDELAAEVEVEAAVFNVLDVRSGCVIVVIDAPAEVVDQLLGRLRPDHDPDGSPDDFTRRWRLQAAREDGVDPSVARSLVRASTPAVSWLHLSDMHVVADGAEQDLWMKSVQRDLPELLRERDIGPDFVVLSGDAAKSAQPAEYDRALDFLVRLRARLPRPNARWVVAPGNHDVDWAAVDRSRDMQLRARLKRASAPPELTTHLAETATQDYLSQRFVNFKKFAERASEALDGPAALQDPPVPLRMDVNGLDIAVVSLNTALLSTSKPKDEGDAGQVLPDLDLQALAIGEIELEDAFEAVEGADVTLAVLHHPPLSEWFHPFDLYAQRAVLGRFDFVHRGHEHMPSQTRRSLAGYSEGTFEVATGALHTWEQWHRGFCAVSLDRDLQFVRTHYFCFGMRAQRWVPDVETAANGVIETRLPRDLAERLREKAGAR